MATYFHTGPSNRGGGAGGRIAVNLTEQHVFQGSFSALGGSSVNSQQHGSPGTVYIEVNVGEEAQRTLQIDGVNRGETFKVFLSEGGRILFRFDRIHLVRGAVLAVQKVSVQ